MNRGSCLTLTHGEGCCFLWESSPRSWLTVIFFFFFSIQVARDSHYNNAMMEGEKGMVNECFFFLFFSESSHIITTIQLLGTPVLTDRMTEVFPHTDAISSYKLPKILSATTLLVGSVTLLCVLKRFSFIWWVKDLFSCRTLNTVRQTHPCNTARPPVWVTALRSTQIFMLLLVHANAMIPEQLCGCSGYVILLLTTLHCLRDNVDH